MPREPVRAAFPDSVVNISVQIPGWLKNDILDLTEKLEVPVGSWVVAQLLRATREGNGLPPVAEPHGPLLTPEEMIRLYARGETIMSPCGTPGVCEGQTMERELVGGMEFCSVCRIRFG